MPGRPEALAGERGEVGIAGGAVVGAVSSALVLDVRVI